MPKCFKVRGGGGVHSHTNACSSFKQDERRREFTTTSLGNNTRLEHRRAREREASHDPKTSTTASSDCSHRLSLVDGFWNCSSLFPPGARFEITQPIKCVRQQSRGLIDSNRGFSVEAHRAATLVSLRDFADTLHKVLRDYRDSSYSANAVTRRGITMIRQSAAEPGWPRSDWPRSKEPGSRCGLEA